MDKGNINEEWILVMKYKDIKHDKYLFVYGQPEGIRLKSVLKDKEGNVIIQRTYNKCRENVYENQPFYNTYRNNRLIWLLSHSRNDIVCRCGVNLRLVWRNRKWLNERLPSWIVESFR